MALRVFVPVGYMPSSVTEGWYLSLCPGAEPVLTALLGAQDTGHHQHHHDHGAGPDADGGAVAMPEHCDLGSGFGGLYLIEALAATAPPEVVVGAWLRPRLVSPGLAPDFPYNSRAPPHLSS